jgi:hypothetical protein
MGRVWFAWLIAFAFLNRFSIGQEAGFIEIDAVKKQIKEIELSITQWKAVREWKSADGKFSTTAKFIERTNAEVTIEKSDGKRQIVPFAKLSQQDVDFVSRESLQELEVRLKTCQESLKVARQSIPKMQRATIGASVISIDSITDELKSNDAKLPIKSGVLVVSVIANSPASQAGLKALDLIQSINGKPVKTVEDFTNAIDSLDVDEICTVAGYGYGVVSRKAFWKRGDVKVKTKAWRDIIVGSLDKTVDDIANKTVYRPPGMPKFVNDKSYLGLYIIETLNAGPMLRMKLYFVAKDWLFIESMTVKTDSNTFTIKFNEINEVERHVGNGISEWVDRAIGDKEREMFEAIADSNSATLRLNGRQFHEDRDLSAEEVSNVKIMLEAESILKP